MTNSSISEFSSNLSQLFIELEREHGTDQLTQHVLHALERAVLALPPSGFQLPQDLREFYQALLLTKPLVPSVISRLQRIALALGPQGLSDKPRLLAELRSAAEDQRGILKRIGAQATKLFAERVTVFIGTQSSTVQAILDAAISGATKPRVILAAPEPTSRQFWIDYLSKNAFDFKVVQEHSISHVLTEIDLAIFGALNLTERGRLLVTSGLSGLLAQLAHVRIPAYVGLSVEKVSLSEDTPSGVVPEQTTSTLSHGTMYTEHSFSHDLVDAQSLSGIITESGILKPREIEKLRVSLLSQAKAAGEIFQNLCCLG